jgi:hypothetical protein
MGDRKNFIHFFRRASRAIKNEVVAVVPQKAERTPVPGAGFSPEAVPGNEVERMTPETVSHAIRDRGPKNERLTPKSWERN